MSSWTAINDNTLSLLLHVALNVRWLLVAPMSPVNNTQTHLISPSLANSKRRFECSHSDDYQTSDEQTQKPPIHKSRLFYIHNTCVCGTRNCRNLTRNVNERINNHFTHIIFVLFITITVKLHMINPSRRIQQIDESFRERERQKDY